MQNSSRFDLISFNESIQFPQNIRPIWPLERRQSSYMVSGTDPLSLLILLFLLLLLLLLLLLGWHCSKSLRLRRFKLDQD